MDIMPIELELPWLELELLPVSVPELEDGKISPPPSSPEEQEKVNAKASVKLAAKKMDFVLFMIYLLIEE
jgi:hypothetical protein